MPHWLDYTLATIAIVVIVAGIVYCSGGTATDAVPAVARTVRTYSSIYF